MSLIVPELTTCIHQDTTHLKVVSLSLHPHSEFRFARYCNEHGIPYFLPLTQEIALKPLLPQRAAVFLPRPSTHTADDNSRSTTLLIRSDCVAAIHIPENVKEERRWRQEIAFLTHTHFSHRLLRILPQRLEQNPLDPTVTVFEVFHHPAAGLQVYVPKPTIHLGDLSQRKPAGARVVEAPISLLGISVMQPFPQDNLDAVRAGQNTYSEEYANFAEPAEDTDLGQDGDYDDDIL